MFQPGQSGNPAGRPRGSMNKITRKLNAATEAVLPLMLARALGGDFEAQKFILERWLPRFKAMDYPIEFSLEEGETSPARAVLQQAAAGELPMSSAKDILNELLPLVQQEQKALERKAQPSGFVNAYLHSMMRG